MHPSTIGPFQIIRELGRGGMGEVFLARDTRLDRQVAIKALPAHLAADPDRLSRFQREAKLLASLNHPNIGAIYGLEESAGHQYLILEFIDGETLADRLSHGAIPVSEALNFARQIAEALEVAHEKGIVHRDLKPGNIMVTADGAIKVLDFGLARTDDLQSTSTSAHALADSPTVTSPARPHSPTIPGAIMGSAGYMSPEQARGKNVDKRSDIFSFGCVLFEMLTAVQPFRGDTVADAIGATLHKELDLSLLPANTPPAVRRLLARCLSKDRSQRLRDIGDARLELSTIEPEAAAAPAGSSRAMSFALAASVLVAACALGAYFFLPRSQPASPQPVVRFDMTLPPDTMLGPTSWFDRPHRPSFVITPDDRAIVFAAKAKDETQLFIRKLDSTTATPIPGTTGANSLFLSPDGHWVAFLADGEIRKTAIAGGPVVKIAKLADGGLASPVSQISSDNDFFGACWGEDDVILFGRFADGLWQVPASGGVPTQFTKPVGSGHRLPHLLPGGHGVLITLHSKSLTPAIAVVPRAGETPRQLLDNASDARFVAPDRLFFARDGILMTVPFDLASQTITGQPTPLVSNLLQAIGGSSPALNSGTAFFDISPRGTLVYVNGGTYPIVPSRLVWVDRQGKIDALPTPIGYYARPTLSPDGKRLAFSHVGMTGSYEKRLLTMFDIDRALLSPLTDRSGWSPLWNKDGTQIYFEDRSEENPHISVLPADGSARLTTLSKGYNNWSLPSSLSPDGSTMLVIGSSDDNGFDIMQISTSGDTTPRPFLVTKSNEAWASFSPDGKMIAYGSDTTGQFEIYIQPFPGPGPRVQVSNGGGISPLWSRSGRELFYVQKTKNSAVRPFVAVDITPGPDLKIGKPHQLFEGDWVTLGGVTNFDISPDDSRFLMSESLPETKTPTTSLHIVMNFSEELRRLTSADTPR